MKINIAADTTYKYLQVFNGIFELTDKEILVLSNLIDLSTTTNLCSASNKRTVADKLGIQDYSTLNNYVKRLKDKGAILNTPEWVQTNTCVGEYNRNTDSAMKSTQEMLKNFAKEVKQFAEAGAPHVTTLQYKKRVDACMNAHTSRKI